MSKIMNILQALKQLRDDIKAWVTVNLNALNDKIDEKTIPIDSELDLTSSNPVQNKVIATEIGKKVDKETGKGLSANDFTDNYKNILDNLGSMAFEETDPTVPDWAKAENKPEYTASEVGALPADTVIPTVPTNVSAFNNDVGYLTEHQSLEGLATETYVDTQIASLVNAAPEALNTLDELAAALGDDENFATTVTNEIASKQDAITGTVGQFVVIGEDGKPTTKTIPVAEEATF